MAFQYPGFQLNAFQITRRADADCSLPSLTAEASGLAAVVGDGDISLPLLTCEVAGRFGWAGQADCFLPSITCSASGSQVVGNVDCSLPSVTCEGHGTNPEEQVHGRGHFIEPYSQWLKRRQWEEQQFRERMRGPNRAVITLPSLIVEARGFHVPGVQERPGVADQGVAQGPMPALETGPLPSPAPSERPIPAIPGVAGQGAIVIPLITADARGGHNHLPADEIEAVIVLEHAA